MLYVGQFRTDRAQDLDFWAVLWQGQAAPPDLRLVAAYNLLTDLRVIVFEAETIEAIRWLDRLNFVGHFECHPALDQTDGYQAAFDRDTDRIGAFLRARGTPERIVAREVSFRDRAIHAPTVWAALELAREQKQVLGQLPAREPGSASP